MSKSVIIGCYYGDLAAYRNGYTVVAVDVVRATTTAVTAAALGRRCFPAPSLEAAWKLADGLPSALLAGEQAGRMPAGFHLNNSPSQIAMRTDGERPLILLSSSGTRLCHAASTCETGLIACLRNFAATANFLANRSSKIAVIAAGTHGEFREEDQMCCAWITGRLLDLGYQAGDRDTLNMVRQWASKPADAWTASSRSVGFLRNSGQLADLDFILGHVEDIDQTYVLQKGEVRPAPIVPSVVLDARRQNHRVW